MIAEVIRTYGDERYEFAGFIVDAPYQSNTRLDKWVVGTLGHLSEVIRKLDISDIALAPADSVERNLFQAAVRCWLDDVEIQTVPMMYAELTGRLPGGAANYDWYLSLLLERSRPRLGAAFLKRSVDIVMALLGLALLVMLLPMLALLIKLDSPGPVFYKQTRVGKRGKTFEIIKLRTMINDAEQSGTAVWAAPADERITRVGRLLRFSMLDELPQFWNVIKGEMSLVGPRPERPELVAELVGQLPLYHVRHAVRPGLAGWAFINQGYARSVDDAGIKLQFDLHYLKSQSLSLDARIFGKSVMRSITLRSKERRGAAGRTSRFERQVDLASSSTGQGFHPRQETIKALIE